MDLFIKNNVCSLEDVFFVVDVIYKYLKVLCEMTKIDINYFLHIVEKINVITFSRENLFIEAFEYDKNYRSYIISDEYFIGIKNLDDDIIHQKYGLTQGLTSLLIKYSLTDEKLKLRNLPIDENSGGLYKGIIEYLTQTIWTKASSDREFIGSIEDKYLLERQFVDYLISAMGKEQFFYYIFKNPAYLFHQISSIPYQGDNLLRFIDWKMKMLVHVGGGYNISDKAWGSSVLDVAEAISDNSKVLKLEKREVNESSS